jgi:hypothetical protein
MIIELPSSLSVRAPHLTSESSFQKMKIQKMRKMIQILEEMKSVKRRKRSPIINSKNLHDLDHSWFGLCLISN